MTAGCGVRFTAASCASILSPRRIGIRATPARFKSSQSASVPALMQTSLTRCSQIGEKVVSHRPYVEGSIIRSAPSHRLWHTLLEVDGYPRGQSSWLTNYAKRYRADLRVGTITARPRHRALAAISSG